MANYWQDRFVQLEKAQMNKGIEYYHELEKQYSKAAEEVQKEIMKWYGRLAKNNEISVSEARKLLTKDELQEFKWSVETYIQKGRENDIDGRWMKELENASAKVHINRLEAMKLQMQQQVEMLYGNELDSFDKHIRDTYTEGFYRSAYEIQKGLGVGTNLAKLDTEKINKIIAKPWTADGSNFSSRIWKQKNQLVNELHNGLSQAFIRGTEPYDLTKQISERFKVSKGQAGRLVMTETAYFHSAAQIDAFKELGVKEYEITAVLDSRTSELCRDMDGKHLPVSEFKPGITAPPFHCWCRSTTVPYFNDEFTEEETRIARGADDKLYEVPYNMTYREWEKAFVDGDHGMLSVNASNEKYGKRTFLGEIDPSKTNEAVIEFGKQIMNEPIENAVVIDADGNVFQFVGETNNVGIYGIDLNGATVIHNHPVSEGIVSFGSDDFMFLRDYQNIELHAFNEQYHYAVKVLKPIDEVVYTDIYLAAMEIFPEAEDMQHLAFEVLRRKGYVDYERKPII